MNISRLLWTNIYMALFSFGYGKEFLNEDILSKQNTKDKNKLTMKPVQGVQTAIQYTANELKGIKLKVDHDRRFRILHTDTCLTIRQLRLNRKPGRWGKPKSIQERSANLLNLRLVPISTGPRQHQYQKCCKLMLLNAQSIKNKDTLVMDKVIESKTDICIITEMWLNDCNNIWIESSKMRKNGCDITTANRKSRQEGGLAIVHRSHMTVKCRGRANLRTFEYAIWWANPNNVTLTILAIYHPPNSDTNKATNSQFIVGFTEFLAKFLMEYSNIIIVVDINIQWNNIEDPDARVYIDPIMALG